MKKIIFILIDSISLLLFASCDTYCIIDDCPPPPHVYNRYYYYSKPIPPHRNVYRPSVRRYRNFSPSPIPNKPQEQKPFRQQPKQMPNRR